MEHEPVKSRSMKFDGTITYGNLFAGACALVSVSIGWGALTNRMDAADQRSVATSLQFSSAISDVREAIKEQRSEMREVQKSVNAITTDTALIRGRLAGGDAPQGRVPK